MSLKSQRELEVTRIKLQQLEETYQEVRRDAAGNPHVQELTLRSLKSLINQLMEEITRYEVRTPAGAAAP